MAVKLAAGVASCRRRMRNGYYAWRSCAETIRDAVRSAPCEGDHVEKPCAGTVAIWPSVPTVGAYRQLWQGISHDTPILGKNMPN